jgi:hypothetical protein
VADSRFLQLGLRDKAQAERYLEWLSQAEPGRAKVALAVLEGAGLQWEGERKDRLASLAQFLQSWYPLVLGPYDPRPPKTALGFWAEVAGPSSGAGFLLELSLLHDVAFILVEQARAGGGALNWSLKRVRHGNVALYWVTVKGIEVTKDVKEFLRSAMTFSRDPGRYIDDPRYPASPAGMRLRLQQLVAELALEQGPASASEAPVNVRDGAYVPEFQGSPEPGPGTLRPPRGLVEALEVYRRIGFFQQSGSLSLETLAALLQSQWEETVVDDMPEEGSQLDAALLALDVHRTVRFDIEADVGPGNQVYVWLVKALVYISDGLLPIASVEEDWSSSGEVTLKLTLVDGAARSVTVADMDDYVDGAAVVRMNDLMAEDGARFWFYDEGPQTGQVVRATKAERSALAQARGVVLSVEPPSWWPSSRDGEDGVPVEPR